ncbi:3-phosphoshikimate 1-carboxyvinyltransferase [Elioraea sp. Yellowstone]|jgi:3-phosphoshikimate 1-carboxyvinyltransferase|uniref:3-phosphoshikimate 1-carboxyvinyltransferase n=1 Tax=Elioraea sp. Yellowstone TaxID=2592070 RepID=UPI00114D90DA|nr:3-phosphoshikimate 1-carboxyvinyltransferase [Elioraea sp. Yellowstone]TQF76952.1 3-phosphoshikimate 1-carboxyvinyltransferase [Elioraea sp. Yellowstone]
MTETAKPMTARAAAGPLSGSVRVPGDKSISHRALMLGALAVGETRIKGLLEGEDVLRTAAAMRALGAEVKRTGEGAWTVHGRGVGGLAEPADVLDMGNSGTAARLLTGIIAGHPIFAVLTGDASLRRRPMGRVTGPLAQSGAEFWAREGGRLPLAIRGAADPMPLDYTLPVASAQVKSAVLLAGLCAPGITRVVEPRATRDHTETMLRGFGAAVEVQARADGGREIRLAGQPELAGRPVAVPADPSSAAFPAVAALLVPGSSVTLEGVGMNPLRAGLYTTLAEMGADLAIAGERDEAGERVADLTVSSSPLRGVDVPAERAPAMIDEYPILAVAAACAAGTTRMRGLAELRVKESDRLAAIAAGLAACGARTEIEGDDLLVHGTGMPPQGGATVATQMDHRIAMAFLVLGQVTAEPVAIDDGSFIDTSFPGFVALMRGLGATIETP